FGFTPAMIMLMKSLNAMYQFWLHTEAINKLPGWFECVFNTPSHHRVHHGSDIEYLDKNHAGILIIWDKIFGTYQEEVHKPKYGLTKNIQSNNPFVITMYEWKNLFKDLKKAKSLYDSINYLFNAPGWSNDGSSKTARQLQAEVSSKCKNCSNISCSKRMKLYQTIQNKAS
ncbi:MAG TPA: sterol desaturase family protein, partial [Chitinophagaceae bacterium]|nr:sterol desaturase family protein [Chitinophagaceae bacterium]